MRRRSRVASVRAVRGHQRHFCDVLPSLRRAARRPCGNGCSRCCAGGRDRSGEDACADETGRADRPVDRRSGIRCRRQACSRVCAGTGIGCRAARCILARFDAGGRSGSDDERRRTAGRSASSRCTAAARDRTIRRSSMRTPMRGPIVGAFRAWPSPQDCFWSSPPPSITDTRARSFATRRRSRRCRSQITVPNAVQAEPTPAPPTTASAQSTRAPAQPTTSSPGTGLPAATATQPAAEATQPSAIRSDAAAAASPDPGAPGGATPSLPSPAAVTPDEGSQASPPVASSPPATEAPSSTASDPPAPQGRSSGRVRCRTARDDSAPSFRERIPHGHARAAFALVSRWSCRHPYGVRLCPRRPLRPRQAPKHQPCWRRLAPAAPVITGNCTASVAALGLCRR